MINVGRGEETIPTVLYFREHGCSLNQLLTQSYTVHVVGLTVVVHISQATGPQTIPVLTSRRDCIVPRSTCSFENGKKVGQRTETLRQHYVVRMKRKRGRGVEIIGEDGSFGTHTCAWTFFAESQTRHNEGKWAMTVVETGLTPKKVIVNNKIKYIKYLFGDCHSPAVGNSVKCLVPLTGHGRSMSSGFTRSFVFAMIPL